MRIRKTQGSSLLELLLVICIIGVLAVKGLELYTQLKKEAAPAAIPTNNVTPTQNRSLVSVSTISSSTCPNGWNMARVAIGSKKFDIFYDRVAERIYGWGTGTNKFKVTYTLTDESNPPGPNGYKSNSSFMVEMMKCEDELLLRGLDNLNDKTHSRESELQRIILENDLERGRYIFEKIYTGLEKIQPPPLRDE